MSLQRAFAISASGLTAQRTRMETVASNLANARTTRLPPWAMWLWTVAALLTLGLPYTGIWALSVVLSPVLNTIAKLRIGRRLIEGVTH